MRWDRASRGPSPVGYHRRVGRGSLLLLFALTACAYHGRDVADDTGDDDVPADAPIDGLVDPTCADLWDYAPSNFEPCPAGGIVHGPLTLTPGIYVFNPMTGVLDQDGTPVMTLPTTGTSPRVLAIGGLVVESGAFLHVGGSTPLIIAVHGDATLAGTIDASAVATRPGPGGDTCAGSAGTNATEVAQWSAGGGGGGGAFGTIGAAGGHGDTELGQPKIPGGAEMSAQGESMLVPLRGGCGGGGGGEEDPRCSSSGTPGTGGGGGGAIQVSVRDGFVLEATAQVAANGGGGSEGINGTFAGGWHVGVGGGGGGSGGGILLESATMSVAPTAILCANGGGGGGGTHNNDGVIDPGSDGICVLGAAPGGSGERGDGGAGAFAGSNPVTGTGGSRQDDGGGGGGGGAGRIRVRAAIGTPPAGFVSTPSAVVD
jgi:hypothetical protein